MIIACLDLEGVLIPEIWINVAELAGVPELRATTRDVPDYDALMRQRLAILADRDIRLQNIRPIIESMAPLKGARDFLNAMRERYQVIILSDTF
jgi:phosphoserine/homoserine phosphotransferase